MANMFCLYIYGAVLQVKGCEDEIRFPLSLNISPKFDSVILKSSFPYSKDSGIDERCVLTQRALVAGIGRRCSSS